MAPLQFEKTGQSGSGVGAEPWTSKALRDRPTFAQFKTKGNAEPLLTLLSANPVRGAVPLGSELQLSSPEVAVDPVWASSFLQSRGKVAAPNLSPIRVSVAAEAAFEPIGLTQPVGFLA